MAQFLPRSLQDLLSRQNRPPGQLIAYLVRIGRTGKNMNYLTKGGEAQARAAADAIAADGPDPIVSIRCPEHWRDVSVTQTEEIIKGQLGGQLHQESTDVLYEALVPYFYPEYEIISQDGRKTIRELRKAVKQTGPATLQVAYAFTGPMLNDLLAVYPHIADAHPDNPQSKPKKLPVHKLVITYDQHTGEITDRHFV